MKCLNCGAEMYEGDLYCANCGTKNDIPSPVEKRDSGEIFPLATRIKRVSRKVSLVLAIIVAICKLLGYI